MKELKKKYVVWVDYGYEGWSPTGYDTLKEAVAHEGYGSGKVITSGEIEYEVSSLTTPLT